MKYSFLTSFLFLIFIGCQKEVLPDVEEPGGEDPIPQFSMSQARFLRTAKFLKKEVLFANANPGYKNIRLFSYDGDMRCTEIKLGTIDSSAIAPQFILKQTLTFNYNSPSKLLPASVSSVRTVFPNLATTFYYMYNALGRKIRDSVRVKNMAGEPADRVIHYEYEADRVFVTPVFTGFPLENSSRDTVYISENGNIERLDSKQFRASGDRIVTYTFTYDNRKSPYSRLNISNSLYFESSELGIGYNVPLETHYMGVTINNLTSYTTNNFTTSFRYVYDESSYPVKKEMILSGDTEPYLTTYFEY